MGLPFAGEPARRHTHEKDADETVEQACVILDERIVDITNTNIDVPIWYSGQTIPSRPGSLTIRVWLITPECIYQVLSTVPRNTFVRPLLTRICNRIVTEQRLLIGHDNYTYTVISPVLRGRDRQLLLLQLVSGRCRPGSSLRDTNCLLHSAEEADTLHTFEEGLANSCVYGQHVQELHFLAPSSFFELRYVESYRQGCPYMDKIVTRDFLAAAW
jgi:hypothetical protein